MLSLILQRATHTVHLSFVRYQMSIAQRRRRLDVDLWRLRPWVIADPSDPEGVLYLSESEFHKYQGICLSNQIPLIVIARGDTDPSHIGKIEESSPSPTDDENQPSSGASSSGAYQIPPHKLKASPRAILQLVGTLLWTRGETLASLTSSNSRELFRKYIGKVAYWTYGSHSTVRLRQALEFANKVANILQHQGSMGLILRLKVSLIALNAYVGGCPLRNTRSLGPAISLTRDGIPRWLPKMVRDQIKQRDRNAIRMWASILNTFKGIKGSWSKPTTGTIATPRSTSSYKHLTAFAYSFWACQRLVPKALTYNVRSYVEELDDSEKYHISSRAGPNGTPSMLPTHILYDAVAWLMHPKGFSYILTLCQDLGYFYLSRDIGSILRYCRNTLPVHLDMFIPYLDHVYRDPEAKLNKVFRPYRKYDGSHSKRKYNYFPAEHSPYRRLPLADQCKQLKNTKSFALTVEQSVQDCLKLALLPYSSPKLGKLSTIKEAAGKVRIIAINDFFTQQALKPLHLWLFDICRYFPQDSTFDQEGSLNAFVQRQDMTEYHSYDLSSATDLIPTQIYESLLTPLVGGPIARTWIHLLVDKEFHYSESQMSRDPTDTLPSGRTRYRRGQPMGALSSWGLMNLAHHLINQYAHVESVLVDIQVNQENSPYFYLIKDLPLSLREVIFGPVRFTLDVIEDNFYPGFIARLTTRLFRDGVLPFNKYVVLGDDNVIGHRPTAECYFSLMTTLYDVPIKLAKSYISCTLINFANQTYFNKVNISPIPFKEYLSLDGLASRLEFATRVTRRFFARPNIMGLLKYVVSSTTWEVLSYKTTLGRVYEPILPLLYSIMILKLPSYIPEVNQDESGTANPIGKFTLIGAITRLSIKLYNNVVRNQLISHWYERIGRKDCSDHPNLRRYMIYLLKTILDPYLGDPKKSLEAAWSEEFKMDVMFPSKLRLTGQVMARRHETLSLEAGVRTVLRRSKILNKIFLQWQELDQLSIDDLCLMFIEVTKDPSLVKEIPTLQRIFRPSYNLDGTEYSPQSMADLRSQILSDASIDKKEERATWEELMTSKLIDATHRYLSLGGSLDMIAPAETVETACLSSKEDPGVTVVQPGGP